MPLLDWLFLSNIARDQRVWEKQGTLGRDIRNLRSYLSSNGWALEDPIDWMQIAVRARKNDLLLNLVIQGPHTVGLPMLLRDTTDKSSRGMVIGIFTRERVPADLVNEGQQAGIFFVGPTTVFDIEEVLRAATVTWREGKAKAKRRTEEPPVISANARREAQPDAARTASNDAGVPPNRKPHFVEQEIVGTDWLYYHLDKRHSAKHLSLCPKGQIGVYRHANEASWGVRDGMLCFFSRDGTLTVEFAEHHSTEDGLRLKGTFTTNSAISLVLEQVETKRAGTSDTIVQATDCQDAPDEAIQPRPLFDIVARFESLGGGTVTAEALAYGCEFGLFQRRAGFESIGLLRWASIPPEGLIRGLRDRFSRIDDVSQMQMRRDGPKTWNALQKTYHLHMAHTGLPYDSFSSEDALKKLLPQLSFLRRKLIESLHEGEKIFVYRTNGGSIPDEQLKDMAEAVFSYGRSSLLFVSLGAENFLNFKVHRRSDALLIGHIDRFAVVNDTNGHNDSGWEAICRSAYDA